MTQPVGEYPPLGPRLLYACQDCADRWTGYGSTTGCNRHNGTQWSGTVHFTAVDPSVLRLLGLTPPAGDTPWPQ